MGNGDGSFSSPTYSYPGGAPVWMAVGDFNRDGKPDLAVANWGDGNVSVLLGNGNGGFSSRTDFTTGNEPESVVVGDFNGDGKQDLAVANFRSSTVSILLGNGNGSFGPATNFAVAYPESVVVADFNGDGKQDLVVDGGIGLSILMGNGDGSFGMPTSVAAGFGFFWKSSTVGDFNGDGNPDLAGAGANGDAWILLGDGNGGFGVPTDFAAGDGPYSVVVGDFNGDGRPDLAVANYWGEDVSILLNVLSVSIGDVTVSEGNTGSVNAYFPVSLSGPSTQTVTVTFSTANGTAIAGSDYVATSGTLTFNPGETTKMITVVVNGDTLNEANETFFVKLGNPVNTAIADGLGIGTISDDDPVPNISINDTAITEGVGGTGYGSFQMNLSAPSGQAVTVSYSTTNGTATPGIDYVDTSGTLIFNPGETTKTIIVLVNGDNAVEPNETFFVNITSASNAMIADGQGIGTILNDDGAAGVRLGNISTRSRVLTGDNLMIGGFIIDGLTPLRVLVRSRGPSMGSAPFFVPGTLANPLLKLFSGQTVIAQNDNWQDSDGAAQITTMGLDPCQPNPGQPGPPPNCNLEAAILITLPPGGYTAMVTGADGGTGVGLVEVFEADDNIESELSNISTRSFVQSGDNVMIGGMIIEGSTQSKVLIRARGPSMSGAPFFVPGTLANPFLQLYSGQTVIAQNNDWQDTPSCTGLVCGGAPQIAATGLDPCQPNPGQSGSPPGCAQESAMIITLPPAAYTAMVSGADGGTGIGLVEVFEVK